MSAVDTDRAIGVRVERKEDGKLLQGQAQWVDNMHVPLMPLVAARVTVRIGK